MSSGSTAFRDTNGRKLFLLALGIAAAVRLLVALFLRPGTDVFYYDQEAIAVLLSLHSPYGHHFSGIPVPLGTVGAENTFAYLPLTVLFLVPFYLMGDIRIGFMVADIAIGITIYALGRGGVRPLLIYWFVPFTVIFSTVYLNNSLIALLFISLFVKLEQSERRSLGAISFGFALSAIQFAWLLFPFVLCYYLRTWRWKESVISTLLALAIIAPFALFGPADFYNNVIGFQFARPTLDLFANVGPLGYNVNPTLNGFLTTLAGVTLPASVRLFASGALLPFFLWRMRDLKGFLIRATGYVLLVMFILPNDFFWSYAELPFVLFLIYASWVWEGRSSTSGWPQETPGGAPTSLQVKPRLQINT